MTDQERLELERALAEPIPRPPAAQKLIDDTLAQSDAELGRGDFVKYAAEYNREVYDKTKGDEMELITKIRNYEAPPRPDATEPEYYSYPDMDGVTTRNIIPAQSDAEPLSGDTRTPEQKEPGPKHVPFGGAGNGA